VEQKVEGERWKVECETWWGEWCTGQRGRDFNVAGVHGALKTAVAGPAWVASAARAVDGGEVGIPEQLDYAGLDCGL
jgi:hypothetical protein